MTIPCQVVTALREIKYEVVYDINDYASPTCSIILISLQFEGYPCHNLTVNTPPPPPPIPPPPPPPPPSSPS